MLSKYWNKVVTCFPNIGIKWPDVPNYSIIYWDKVITCFPLFGWQLHLAPPLMGQFSSWGNFRNHCQIKLSAIKYLGTPTVHTKYQISWGRNVFFSHKKGYFDFWMNTFDMFLHQTVFRGTPLGLVHFCWGDVCSCVSPDLLSKCSGVHTNCRKI